MAQAVEAELGVDLEVEPSTAQRNSRFADHFISLLDCITSGKDVVFYKLYFNFNPNCLH